MPPCISCGRAWGTVLRHHVRAWKRKALHVWWHPHVYPRTHLVSEILHITWRDTLVYTWLQRAFTSAIAIDGDKGALWACVGSNACWANLMWTLVARTWHQKSFHSKNRSSLVAQPSSFRFRQWHYFWNGFYIRLHLTDPSFIYPITVIHLFFSFHSFFLIEFKAGHCKKRLILKNTQKSSCLILKQMLK